MKEQQNCWSDDPAEIQHPTDKTALFCRMPVSCLHPVRAPLCLDPTAALLQRTRCEHACAHGECRSRSHSDSGQRTEVESATQLPLTDLTARTHRPGAGGSKLSFLFKLFRNTSS